MKALTNDQLKQRRKQLRNLCGDIYEQAEQCERPITNHEHRYFERYRNICMIIVNNFNKSNI